MIFDLDGTLVDSRRDLTIAVNCLLQDLGYPEISVDQVGEFIGDGTPKLAERSLKYVGAIDSTDDPQFRDYYRQLLVYYEENLANKTTVYPGVYDFLETHAAHPMAVVTNKPEKFTLPVLEAFDLAQYFSFTAGGDRYEKRKPDPYPLQQAMQALEVSSDETVMIGDGDTDIRAGNAAGVTTVAVSYGNRHIKDLQRLHPDYTIHEFSALDDIIGNLRQQFT